MHPAIQFRVEGKRGCGFRKSGGLYLVTDGPSMPCGKLPIPLDVCPCCGNGIKPSRGWTWVNGTTLAAAKQCSAGECSRCPLGGPPGRVGLLWIGEQFYATPDEWNLEASQMGISRRIAAVPRDFKLGETWVWVAHRKTIRNADGSWTAGVFQAFRPARIEYVVHGDETDAEIDALVKRGITPVRVEKANITKELFGN